MSTRSLRRSNIVPCPTERAIQFAQHNIRTDLNGHVFPLVGDSISVYWQLDDGAVWWSAVVTAINSSSSCTPDSVRQSEVRHLPFKTTAQKQCQRHFTISVRGVWRVELRNLLWCAISISTVKAERKISKHISPYPGPAYHILHVRSGPGMYKI